MKRSEVVAFKETLFFQTQLFFVSLCLFPRFFLSSLCVETSLCWISRISGSTWVSSNHLLAALRGLPGKLEATRLNNLFLFGSFLKGKTFYFRENYWWFFLLWPDLFLNIYICIDRYIHCLLYRYRKKYVYLYCIHSSFYVFWFTYNVHLSLLQIFLYICRKRKRIP